MLLVFLAALLSGIGSVVALFAPYSSYGRIAANIFAPVYRWGNNILAFFAEEADSYAFYATDVWIKSVPTFLIALATFIIIAVLAWRNGRTYCNTICPVGTVLGLFSRYALLRPMIENSKCKNCGLCSRKCKAACIDYKEHRIDYSRCVACMDCIEACKHDALHFSCRLKKNKEKKANDGIPLKQASDAGTKIDSGRRNFLRIMGMAGVAVAGMSSCTNKSGRTAEGTETSEIPTDKMTYRSTPTTNDKVSLLGFGMMRLPSKSGRSAREGEKEEIDQNMVNELVDYAIAHGVNYFDTSPAYCQGNSEHSTGIALSRYPREKYYIATKLSNFAPETWTREASIAMYQNSLKELQTDHIDYMLMHGVGMGDGMNEFESRYIKNGMLDYLVEERKSGRIRNLGFSYHGDVKVFDYLLSQHEKYRWDFVQIQLNYLDWKYAKQINERNTNAEYLYGELSKRGIPAIIMEPLLGGRLSNVPDRIVERLKQREPERSVASWAFRFAGSKSDVLTVLSGMTRLEHLQDNLRSFAPLKPLTDEELRFLQDTATEMMKYDTIPCNNCKYCMPCPYGLDIPAILLHYNKCLNENNVPSNSKDKDYERERRAFLVGYDRSVPKLRQASHCIGCGQCSPHCPQRIDIPEELHRIDAYAEQLKQHKM